jgi:hypothetical protein
MKIQTGSQRPPVQIVMIRWNVFEIGCGLVVTDVTSVFMLLSYVDATKRTRWNPQVKAVLMPGVEVRGQYQLRELSARLREAGTEGKGLRRKLMKQMNDAARPLAKEISSVEHLKPYMPDRYAAILAADLGVRVAKSFSKNPRVEIRAKAKQHKRKVAVLDAGLINHPIYAQGERKTWSWSNAQTGGMKAGFFTDACKRQTPQIRDQILKAMTETAKDITG